MALVVAAALVAVAALGGLATVLAGAVAGGSPMATVTPGLPVTVVLPPGASARTIGDILEDAGVVAGADLENAARSRGVAGLLRAGEYSLETGMTPDAVVEVLLAGPIEHSDLRVTVIEGWTIAEVLASLADQTPYDVADYEAALVGGGVTSPYLPTDLPDGVPALAAWEGLLFPAKYEIADDDPPSTILQRMATEMAIRLDRQDWSRLGELGVDRYQALIVASLVEQEAKLDEDRPLIARVIYNRLAAQMPLQIDATVIYAKGENTGRVTAADLETDSPYNTYRIPALPPTPIGTVGQASLDAATDPADGDYLFYVVVSADGGHGFSVTYEEHQAKVEKAKADGILP